MHDYVNVNKFHILVNMFINMNLFFMNTQLTEGSVAKIVHSLCIVITCISYNLSRIPKILKEMTK